MLTFSKMYGFEFFAHIIRDPNRKGKVERPFYYIETNFLAGRTFKNWDDLNQQAIQWCLYANQKEKRDLGMTPECAYVQEKPHLVQLPEILPPIYEHYQRIVDSNGFINLDTNKYSAPEHLIGRTLDVYKYPEEVRLFYKRNEIAIHRRLSGKRCEVSSIPEHHIKHVLQKTQEIINNIESVLCSYHEILDLYITDLKKHVRGRGMRAINKLLDLKHTYPQDAFIQAVKQAHKYGLYDLNRLEELTIKLVAGNYFNLQEEEL